MIGYLKGNLIHAENSVVIMEVNGVGFEMTCSNTLFSRLVENNGGAAYTYTAVKEDGISLYGFDNLAEKNMFLQLITVSGVGPKMGIAILSSTSLNDLAMYIATSDVKSLSKIKGLGKKSAERIIVELREAMQKVPLQKTATKSPKLTTDGDNAVLALMSLGYNRTEATAAVERSLADGNTSLNDVIKGALRYFA